MATSRTGTTKYLRNSARVKRQAQADGLTHCPAPGCGVLLNWDTPGLDNSAEADHIVEARHGIIDDSIENLRVWCRKSNRDRTWNKTKPKTPALSDFPTSRAW